MPSKFHTEVQKAIFAFGKTSDKIQILNLLLEK